MILLQSSILLLLCGIICCQESLSPAPTGDTKLLLPTTIPENSSRENEPEKSEKVTKPDATPDDPQNIARRKNCCKDGRQHFYTNGNCANRSKEENEAVGLWCDHKFLECCLFMEAYYMGPVGGCRCRNNHHNSQLPSQGIIPENSPKKNEPEKSAQSEKVTVVDDRESQTKPDSTTATPGDDVTINSTTPIDDLHFKERRRKCCEDGRQHFYTNGNCANRPQKENEAVGLWCDQKFLECCSFMEAYYMGPADGCRCRSKQPSSQLSSPENSPEDSTRMKEEEKPAQSESVTVVDGHESQTKPDATPATPGGDDVMTPKEDPQYIIKRSKCCQDGRQHFYTNGNCDNRPQKENEAVGLWCDRKFMQCCTFMKAYYMGPVDGCRNRQCNSQLPSPTETSLVTNTPLNQ